MPMTDKQARQSAAMAVASTNSYRKNPANPDEACPVLLNDLREQFMCCTPEHAERALKYRRRTFEWLDERTIAQSIKATAGQVTRPEQKQLPPPKLNGRRVTPEFIDRFSRREWPNANRFGRWFLASARENAGLPPLKADK